MVVAAAVGAVGEVGEGEGGGDGADVEAERVAGAVDLADGEPDEEHLDVDALERREPAGGGGAGDAGAVPDQPRPRQHELAVPREVHLEAPVLPELVPLHPHRQDPPREVVLLQHLVRRRRRCRRPVAGRRHEEEDDGGGEEGVGGGHGGGRRSSARGFFWVDLIGFSPSPSWLLCLEGFLSLCRLAIFLE